MGSHPERLVAASQSREDSVRQRLRKILIERAVRVEAKRFGCGYFTTTASRCKSA